jgi:hypothetical protein
MVRPAGPIPDDIEVTRHRTARLCKAEPLFFFVNFAVGGTSGGKIDLSQYAGIIDMYVDRNRSQVGDWQIFRPISGRKMCLSPSDPRGTVPF